MPEGPPKLQASVSPGRYSPRRPAQDLLRRLSLERRRERGSSFCSLADSTSSLLRTCVRVADPRYPLVTIH